MACICSFQYTGLKIEAAVPDRNKHILRIVHAELIIYKTQYFGGSVAHHGNILYQDLRYHHKKRRRNTFSRNIGHYDTQMSVIKKEEIIEIAAYFLSRIHRGIDIEIITLRKCRKDIGQSLCLNSCGHRQLSIKTLFLFLLDLISLKLNAGNNIIQIGSSNYRNNDDKLDLLEKYLNDYCTDWKCQIDP